MSSFPMENHTPDNSRSFLLLLENSLLPSGLMARIFVLISSIVVLTTAAWLTIASFAEAEPRAKNLAQLASSNVNLVRAALFAAAPDKRRGLFGELSGREGIRLLPGEIVDIKEQPHNDRFFAIVEENLRKKLGKDTQVALSINDTPGFWVSFHLEEGDEEVFWLMLPREHTVQASKWNWLIWVLLSLVVAMAGAALIARRITQPLAGMAKAAAAIGRGQNPPPLPEVGATEIQTLAHAFNSMHSDLTRNEQERAEILAGISHDLRTPLARLRLEVEMSVRDEIALEGMSSDISQMDSVIGQFLDYARGEREDLQGEVDINDLVGSVITHQASIGQPVVFHSEPLPPMSVQPKALRRALDNLITNAFKYGEPPVQLQVWSNPQYVELEVLDRGPGIPPEEAERLKRPFTRLETARSNATGTGLGLAIVDRICKKHGGSLDLLPREGGGLIARIRLPRKAF